MFILIYFGRSNDDTRVCSSASEQHCETCSPPAPEFTNRSSIDMKLERRFNDKMRNDSVPLLKDYTTYCAHLPRRKLDGGPVLRLYEHEYLVRSGDLKRMSNAIDKPLEKARSVVHYISAPPASGKTASVLPSFLETAKATHYLYLPFHNNNGNWFKAAPYNIEATDEETGEQQGAAFMTQCVKNLLEGKGYGKVPVIDDAPSIDSMENDLTFYLQQKLGDGYRIWFHIDEHRKMINRDYPNDIQRQKVSAAFSRGAMTILAGLNNSRVIVTYVELPTEVPTEESSTCCRHPIALAPLDVDQAMAHVPELRKFNPACIDETDEKRLWVTLRFRLAMKIDDLYIPNVLHLRGRTDKVKQFLSAFEKLVDERNTSSPKGREDLLMELIELCKTEINKRSSSEFAAKLFVGISDIQANESIFQKRLTSGLIVCDPNNLITCGLSKLLEMEDPNIPVYEQGRDLFAEALQGASDLLSATPLEHAYFWSLACRSAVKGSLSFGAPLNFNIKCDRIEPKRLFKGDGTKLDQGLVKELEKNVMYYADERRSYEKDGEGKRNHPIADIFFVSNNDQLVLIDITGSGVYNVVNSKISEKTKWIHHNKYYKNIKKFLSQDNKPIKQILEPKRCIAIDGKADSTENVNLVSGTKARSLLGGLGQNFH